MTSSSEQGRCSYMPYTFTKQRVSILSTVLKNEPELRPEELIPRKKKAEVREKIAENPKEIQR
ncbi:hypothetical protein [Methanococcoides sp. NM1]|uniref:hypothetical protein n=1 Tax=Methanococcoides sp. NM1 TaxID=1201013 RepID=UPI00108261B2|nr:hypothetical protein [Methanococcoides sp. NM1]